MATTTPKLGLILPAGQEKVSRQVINDNMVKIDQASLNRSEFVFNPEVMKEAISAITGVQSVDIFMNRAEDEAGGIPGESIMVFVHNGSAASIAQAIYDTNTSGLDTAGSIVRTVEETEVRFSRPTLNIIYPTITIEADYAAPDVATLGTPIKTAVYNYINSLGLGGTLHTEHLKEAIKASVGATLAATFNISKVQISGDFGIMYDGVITPEWNAKYAVFTVDSVTVVSQVNPHSKAIATQRTAMSYLVNGNVSTEAIPAGAYFQLVNSLITGRSDGEYTASKAIPANTAIDSTYFNESAPITGGGLNALNSKIANIAIENVTSQTSDASGNIVSPILKSTIIIDYAFSNGYILLPYKANSSNYWKFLVCDVNPTTGAITIQKNVTGTLTVHYLAHPA